MLQLLKILCCSDIFLLWLFTLSSHLSQEMPFITTTCHSLLFSLSFGGIGCGDIVNELIYVETPSYMILNIYTYLCMCIYVEIFTDFPIWWGELIFFSGPCKK